MFKAKILQKALMFFHPVAFLATCLHTESAISASPCSAEERTED